MKKFLLVAAVAGIAMASCKKDYDCKCTVKWDASTGSPETTSVTTIKNTKKKAKESCEGQNASVAGSYTTTCAIQ